jgi:hypothetical protein
MVHFSSGFVLILSPLSADRAINLAHDGNRDGFEAESVFPEGGQRR